jgi:O-antigen/teichoic acid export membrane protein
LRRAFLKFMNYICILSVPFFTGLAIVAPELVNAVFGDKWQPAIFPMQILCVSGIVGVMGAVVQPPLLSKGRPDIVLKLSIGRLVILPIFLLIGIRYGMVGAATAVSAATLLLTAVNYLFVNRLLNLGMRDLAIAVGPSALGAGVMAIILLILRHFIVGLGALQSYLLLIVSIFVGVVTYYLTFKVFRFRGLDEIVKLCTDIILRRESSAIE